MLKENLDLKELEEVVVNISRKASRNSDHVEFEDMVQEIWLHLFKLDQKSPIESFGLAVKVAQNKAIDIIRASGRKNDCLRNVDYSDPIGQVFVESNMSDPTTKIDDSALEILELIEALPEKERNFVIVKGYLKGNLECLKEKYENLYNALEETEKEKIDNDSKILDDTILKVFLKIKTGVNSGSARGIKNNLKSLMLGC